MYQAASARQEKGWVVFFYRGIGPSFKNPVALSIYLSKKRAPCLSAYLSISPKNERLTFFCFPPPPPSHAFVGFLKDEKWHAGPDFTPVSGKNSREMALRWPRLGFSSHFLQPIYLSLQKTSASPLSLSIYLSKYRALLKFGLYLRGTQLTEAAQARARGGQQRQDLGTTWLQRNTTSVRNQ